MTALALTVGILLGSKILGVHEIDRSRALALISTELRWKCSAPISGEKQAAILPRFNPLAPV